MKADKAFALAGAVLMIPALTLVSCSLLHLPVPMALVQPVLVIGGMLLACGLNFVPILSFGTDTLPDGTEAVTIRLARRAWNLAVLLSSALLLMLIGGYVVVENFHHGGF
jgi:hypothetical protein